MCDKMCQEFGPFISNLVFPQIKRPDLLFVPHEFEKHLHVTVFYILVYEFYRIWLHNSQHFKHRIKAISHFRFRGKLHRPNILRIIILIISGADVLIIALLITYNLLNFIFAKFRLRLVIAVFPHTLSKLV